MAAAREREMDTDRFARMIARACGSGKAQAAGWQLEPDTDAIRRWLRVRSSDARPPAQGWKLHVSADVASATRVLRRALPVLLSEDTVFKVAASPHALMSLNSGDGGSSQIGKFITVYPTDDEQAVRLAVALDEATVELSGPAVPSDRPLRPGSLVHYRYGGFDAPYMQTALGEILPALRAPNGTLEPDRRLSIHLAPAWAADPFIEAGVATRRIPSAGLLSGRYLVVSSLSRTARGSVSLAVDTADGSARVLKRARRGGTTDQYGRDARVRLRHEARVLRALAPSHLVPAVFDLFQHEDDVVLVLEEVEGETLEQHLRSLIGQSRLPSPMQVIDWGRGLARVLGAMHERGVIYRDLKPTNVIIGPDARPRLVDFELAHVMGDGQRPFGVGTRGYVSPQQDRRLSPAVTDDVYGLGALLYFLATGAEPSRTPHPFALLDRPPRLLSGAIGTALASVIARCLDPEPDGRYPTMAALEEAIAAAVLHPPIAGGDRETMTEPARKARRRHGQLALRLGDTICRAATPATDGRGVLWRSTHQFTHGIQAQDLNWGSAGALLALAEIAGESRDPVHLDTLAQGARWLAEVPPLLGGPLPGLYVGQAGIGAALLRAGQVLRDTALIDGAVERGRLVASLPHRSPDLFNGTAGRLRFHLWLWDETGATEHLRAAVAAGKVLVAASEEAGDDAICWRIPPGYDGLSDIVWLGYAHGAAGIADALLDLYDASGDEQFRAVGRKAGQWLARQAVPALDDGSGLAWPTVPGGMPTAAMWCHGAAGIGRFFLHAAQVGTVSDACDLATRAARAVGHGTRWASPTQCHGLAGNIEFLLDMYQTTGDPELGSEVQCLARLLEAFASEQEGTLVWPSESPAIVTPDYMVGYAGVAVCLLRLSDPERRPHQLSRAGFRYSRRPPAVRHSVSSPLTGLHATSDRST